MDKDRKKELREGYANRHPDMGVVCWQCGDEIWAAVTKDERASYNGTSFQLKLGSWPNRELQAAYSRRSGDFKWFMAKKLDYKEPSDVTGEDLELLLMEFMEEHPEAKPMKPGKKLTV